MPNKKRVLVVVNKWWECDPVMNVLLYADADLYKILKWPDPLNHPRMRPNQQPPTISANPGYKPRAIFHTTNIQAEVWCISDLIEDLAGKYQSSSEQKAKRLAEIFKGQQADLVVAVGTAAYPSQTSENGSVVVGTKVFMHNAYANNPNPDSDWKYGRFEDVIDSALDKDKFDKLTDIETKPNPSVMDRFLVPPLNPVQKGSLIAEYDNVALGVINVTDYKNYCWADKETWKAYRDKVGNSKETSLETTHGLIRAQLDFPFLFVSGITDRVGHFDEEVDQRSYAQNTTAAHNAGVVVAWMLPKIDQYL